MKTNQMPSVTTQFEIPEDLYQELVRFAEEKGMDWDRIGVMAISLNLMQNGKNSTATNAHYLDALFGNQA